MEWWFTENLWDLEAWKCANLQLTTSSNEAARLFDAVVRQIVAWTDSKQLGGIANTVERMLAATGLDFPMGKVLSLGLDALGTGRSVNTDRGFEEELSGLVAHARSKRCTEREINHAQAVDYYGHGQMQSACIVWERILAEHPNDLMAIKFLHDAYFFLGDHEGKRDSILRVIGKWEKSALGYGFLHGMLAFGLEECGDYEKSLEQGRIGLSLNRHDCWSTHAIAHCMEMRSENEKGIRFMESTLEDWRAGNVLAGHNYWHKALFHIEGGDLESALSIYDNEIGERSRTSGMMLDLIDASSLLTRSELEGADVGKERWKDLARLMSPHIDDHVLAFNDAHISMALAHAGDDELVERHQGSIHGFISSTSAANDQARLIKDIGQAICGAIIDFNARRYDQAFEKLYPVRSQVFRIGGSHAQRDVFVQLLISAGLRSSNADQKTRAMYSQRDLCLVNILKTIAFREVIEERDRLKPNSPLTRRYMVAHRRNHV